jgi:two-component system cell cycle response regulator
MAEYYDVSLVSDAVSAWDAIPTYVPDVILINCRLSDGDGYAFCARVKSNPDFGHTPVIMVASSNGEVDWQRAYSCFADDIQELPLDFPILHPRLQSLMRSKASLDEMRLRTKTSATLGLSEPHSPFHGKSQSERGKVALVECCIDDCDELVFVLKDEFGFIIEQHGYNAQPAIDSDCSTLVIMATSLGNKSLKLLADLRGSPRHRNKTILFACHKFDRTIARKAFDLGANDVLFAPFNTTEFALRARALINHAQHQESLRASFDKSLELATIDPLTGLYNRRYAMRYLEKALERSRTAESNLIAMSLDLDQFKQINDRYGHGMGDTVLNDFAQRLRANLRGIDMIARMGGEEFLVIIPRISNQRAEFLAERLRAVISEKPFLDADSGQKAVVTVSIGMAQASMEDDPQDLLNRADRALYQSKQAGRDKVTFGIKAA